MTKIEVGKTYKFKLYSDPHRDPYYAQLENDSFRTVFVEVKLDSGRSRNLNNYTDQRCRYVTGKVVDMIFTSDDGNQNYAEIFLEESSLVLHD
jgi:hypothetical protein